MSVDPHDIPQQEPAEPPRPGRKWTTGVVALVVVFVALAGYDLISSGVASAGRPSAPPRPPAAPRARRRHRPDPRLPSPAPAHPSLPAPVRAPFESRSEAGDGQLANGRVRRRLRPDGASDGDHPNLAPGIINGGDGKAWYSSWYKSPEFGNLQSGTGLMLDMGETVNLSQVHLILGAPVGADVQVRVGNTVAASAYDVGGTVQLRLTTPVSGRYVLIWFTQLPPKQQGEYQVTVYSAAVYGTKGTLFVALGTSHRPNLMRSVVIQLPYSHDDCGAWHIRHRAEREPLLRRATARLRASVPRPPDQPAPGGQPGAVARADIAGLAEGGFEISVSVVDDDTRSPGRRCACAESAYDDVITGDLRSGPIPQRAYDVVYCALLLERVHHVELVLDRLVSALKPGGLLLLRTGDRRTATALLDRLLPGPVRRAVWSRFRPGVPGPFRPVYEKAVCDEGIASYALLRGLVIATRGTELPAPIIRPGYHRRCGSSAPPSPGSPEDA